MTEKGEPSSERAITLSLEELAVLAGLLGLRLALPAARLAELTSRQRRDHAVRAVRSLADRRALIAVDGIPALPQAVAALIEVVCVPRLRAEIHIVPSDAPPVRHDMRLVPEAGVELRRVNEGYRCTPFRTADLLARIVALTALDAHGVSVGEAFTVPRAALAECFVAARRGDATEAAGALIRADAPVPEAMAFGAAARARHSVVHLQVRYAAGGARWHGGELSWLAVDRHVWQIPSFDAPFARIGGRSAPSDFADVPITIIPTDDNEILRGLASLLPGGAHD